MEFSTRSGPNTVLIGLLSALGTALCVTIVIGILLFFKFTSRGRILLDRLGRPGEFDDEQAFLREETEALEAMDDLERQEYWRAKAFIESNPPDSMTTDISLSQFLAIQEKGVSAWEFEAELEIANCFVEARTEIEFFDSVCRVQSNLPVPKQNEVYYWEAKLFEKADSTLVSIGMTTKPYPMFRLPGWHKYSIAYTSDGHKRFNQPFNAPLYALPFAQGDVIGVGFRPRTGTIFFTRNGKKLEDIPAVHAFKTLNLFPTIGANGPATIHVNFGQMGFVFIEANVKKWGLAPMTGSLAPPPPYGSEQGSILLEGGRGGLGLDLEAGTSSDAAAHTYTQQLREQQLQEQRFESERAAQQQHRRQQSLQQGHSRSRSGIMAGLAAASGNHGRTSSLSRNNLPPTSPGPVRSPTDISLANIVVNNGESVGSQETVVDPRTEEIAPPPEYSGPSRNGGSSNVRDRRQRSNDQTEVDSSSGEETPLLPSGPVPTYEHVVAEDELRRSRAATPSGDHVEM